MSKAWTVLLLAGDPLTALLATSGLAPYGYTIRSATDVPSLIEALEATPAASIAALVIDVDVPGEPDGLAVAKRARQLDPNLAVIYTARQPHRIPEARKVANAPILRTPYYAQQVAGLINELRSRPRAEAIPSRAA